MKKVNEELRELLKLEWDGNEKMVDLCLRDGNYVQIGDYWVCVADTPIMNFVLWYDYYPIAPSFAELKDWKTFHLLHCGIEKRIRDVENNTILLGVKYHENKSGGRLRSWFTSQQIRQFGSYDESQLVELTREEKKILLDALVELRERYVARLERYYKKTI